MGRKEAENSNETPKGASDTSQQSNFKPTKLKKGLVSWRSNRRNQVKPLHVQKTQLDYLNIANGDKNLLEDVLIPLL